MSAEANENFAYFSVRSSDSLLAGSSERGKIAFEKSKWSNRSNLPLLRVKFRSWPKIHQNLGNERERRSWDGPVAC